MGERFHDVRTILSRNALIVRSTLRASLALFLHGNPQYADEIQEALDVLIRMLENDEFDTEDALHKAVQEAFTKVMSDKPVYVRAAIGDLLDALVQLAAEKIMFDEDKVLSAEEKEAWLTVLRGMRDICVMVQQND